MNIFPGSILLLPIMWGIIGVYPFVEAWVTGDKREHHLLDRPRNAPTRTGIGVAGITMYCVLFFAAGNDLIAIKLHLSINDITIALRMLFFVGPPIAFWITKRICLSLQRADREKVLHGRETGTIWRYPDGRFEEIHAPLTPNERWPLVQQEVPEPLQLSAEKDANGVDSPHRPQGAAPGQAVALLLRGPRRTRSRRPSSRRRTTRTRSRTRPFLRASTRPSRAPVPSPSASRSRPTSGSTEQSRNEARPHRGRASRVTRPFVATGALARVRLTGRPSTRAERTRGSIQSSG